MEPFNEHAGVETMVFGEENGQTTLTVTSVYPSIEIRDALCPSVGAPLPVVIGDENKLLWKASALQARRPSGLVMST